MSASTPESNRRPPHVAERSNAAPRPSPINPSSGERTRLDPNLDPRRWLNWRLAAYVIAAAIALLLAGTLSPRRLVSYHGLLPLLAFIVLAGTANAAIAPLMARFGGWSGCLTFGIVAALANVALTAIAARFGVGMEFSIWGMVTASVLLSIAAGFVFSLFDERTMERAGAHAE